MEYALRLFPIGGYVAFPDDEPDCPYEPDDPDLLRNRPASDRALVVSAGVLANIAFALATLFTQVETVGLAQQVYRPGVLVPGVGEGSVAYSAGLRSGDVLLEVDGEALPGGQPSVRDVVRTKKDGESVRSFLGRVRDPFIHVGL